jgi:hypothetical protein
MDLSGHLTDLASDLRGETGMHDATANREQRAQVELEFKVLDRLASTVGFPEESLELRVNDALAVWLRGQLCLLERELDDHRDAA